MIHSFQHIVKNPIDLATPDPNTYQKNKLALKQASHQTPSYNQLIKQLDAIPPLNQSDYDAHQAAYGLSFSYKDIPLYADSAPLPEIQALLLNHCHTSADSHHLIFGMGLGHLAESVFNYADGRVYIYEPDLQLLKMLFTHSDLSHLLESDRVHLLSTASHISESLLQHYMHGDTVDLLYLESTAALWQSKLACVIRDYVKPVLERKKNSLNVTLAYHHQWCESFFQSLAYLPKAVSFEALTKTTQQSQKPAIIISAGPSLDKNLTSLKEIAPYATLVCVGRALGLLLQHNIIPDYCVFLDFEGPDQQLADIPESAKNSLNQVNFIMGPFAQACCYATPAKRHYYTHLESYGGFSTWLNATLNENAPLINGGGTVSMLALNTGIAMGHSHIILLGQDLAFQGTQIYAGDVHVTELHDERYTFSETHPHSGTTLKRDIPVIKTKGQQGETLLTGQDYDLYRQHLEEFARDLQENQALNANQNSTRSKDVKLFNASTGGAHIEGFEAISLDRYKQTYMNAIPNPPTQSTKTDPLEQYNAPLVSQRSNALLKELISTVRHIEAMRHDAKHILKQHPALSTLIHRELSTTRAEVSRKTTKELKQHQHYLKKFSDKLMAHPIIHYALQREVWFMHRRSYQDQQRNISDTEQAKKKHALLKRVQCTIELDIDYIKACCLQLEAVQIMTNDAIEAIQAQNES